MSRNKLSAWQIFLDVSCSLRELFPSIDWQTFIRPKDFIKGLWSVYSINRLPCRYLWNFVTANIIHRASFSIWEYCFPPDSKDLEACATAFREPSGSLWRMQAPMSYELASLATMMSRVGS